MSYLDEEGNASFSALVSYTSSSASDDDQPKKDDDDLLKKRASLPHDTSSIEACFKYSLEDTKPPAESSARAEAPPASTKTPSMKDESGFSLSFPRRLMEALSCEDTKDSVAWVEDGKSFVLADTNTFVSEVLPRFFKPTKLPSFIRKMNRWGFKRFPKGPNAGAFYHKLFQRDRPELCKHMGCTQSRAPQVQPRPIQPADAATGMSRIRIRKLMAKATRTLHIPPSFVPPLDAIHFIPEYGSMSPQQSDATNHSQLHHNIGQAVAPQRFPFSGITGGPTPFSPTPQSLHVQQQVKLPAQVGQQINQPPNVSFGGEQLLGGDGLLHSFTMPSQQQQELRPGRRGNEIGGSMTFPLGSDAIRLNPHQCLEANIQLQQRGLQLLQQLQQTTLPSYLEPSSSNVARNVSEEDANERSPQQDQTC